MVSVLLPAALVVLIVLGLLRYVLRRKPAAKTTERPEGQIEAEDETSSAPRPLMSELAAAAEHRKSEHAKSARRTPRDAGRTAAKSEVPPADNRQAPDDVTLTVSEIARAGELMEYDKEEDALICVYPAGTRRPVIELVDAPDGRKILKADGKTVAILDAADITVDDILVCEGS